MNKAVNRTLLADMAAPLAGAFAATGEPASKRPPRNAAGSPLPTMGPMGAMPTRLVMRHNGMEPFRIRFRSGRKNGRKSGYTPPKERD